MVTNNFSYNVVSIFSGAMGLDLGLEKAGMKVAVCVEMDKLACKTIRANSNIPVIENDINKITTDEILTTASLSKEEVFAIVGGPPCQAFSTAGKRLSLQDFRGNAIIRYLQIIEEISPPYFILENVRGILSTPLNVVPPEYEKEYNHIVEMQGSMMYFLWQEFSKLGYQLSFTLFNSANYGVPQARERVIIFGSKKGRIPLPTPTHSQTGQETGKKWTSLKEAFQGLENVKQDYLEIPQRIKKYLTYLKEGQNWRDLPPEVQKEAMGNSLELVGGKTGFFRRLSFSEPSPTLLTSPIMNATLLAHPTEMRALSVQEYARIQQFPDNWKFVGKLTDIYKQIGNAVPVGLGYVAGRTLIDFHEENYDAKREKNNIIPYSRYLDCCDFEFIPKFKNQVIQKEQVKLSLF
ncbi:DNA cytosine methyltransferase [Hugenholtzia roseola]|uniref:DNA cytosine methyltransferase n=1 Tax=Hugenholtzia roseola TaxID=1002 RepID=UPI00042828FB|nr:DNA cytosine methyltransferase [Hugenholtzia roseola]